jgi:hypothetical protein
MIVAFRSGSKRIVFVASDNPENIVKTFLELRRTYFPQIPVAKWSREMKPIEVRE